MLEINVRMGDLAVTAARSTALVSIGLGSCIGLALLDAGGRVGGLAHIMLPGPGAAARRRPATFADTAVPALIAALERLGARHLGAVIVGGAQMFGPCGAGGLQIGARNEHAVRTALAAANVPILAAQTGGGRGRTIRVHPADMRVTARVAGLGESVLLGPTAVPA